MIFTLYSLAISCSIFTVLDSCKVSAVLGKDGQSHPVGHNSGKNTKSHSPYLSRFALSRFLTVSIFKSIFPIADSIWIASNFTFFFSIFRICIPHQTLSELFVQVLPDFVVTSGGLLLRHHPVKYK